MRKGWSTADTMLGIESEREAEIPAGATVGAYLLEERIGQGAFGDVYRAVHRQIGRRSAIKILAHRNATHSDAAERFAAEARAANLIEHPNIIDVFDFGQLKDGRLYLVMELLEGETLADRMLRGPLAPEELVPICKGLTSALDAAHAKGIIHRDLKPENVFLVPGPSEGEVTPKLLDFGIAKLLDPTGEVDGHATKAGTTIGTPHYMSPEQCHSEPVSPQTDIYALGVMCFEALSGGVPFDGPSLFAIMLQHCKSPRPSLTEIQPKLKAFDRGLRRMMAIEPEERPHSAGDSFDLLEKALSELQGNKRPTTEPLTPVPRPGPQPLWQSTRSQSQEAEVALRGFQALDLDSDGVKKGAEAGGLMGLWQAAHKELGDPWLPLRVGAAVPFGAYEIIDYLGSASNTVGEALTQIERYFGIVTSAVSWSIAVEGNRRIVSCHARVPDAQHARIVLLYSIGVTFSRFQALASDFGFSSAHLAFPEEATKFITEFFDCPLHFDSEVCQFEISEDAWRAPLSRREPGLRSVLERHAAELLERRSQGREKTSERIREAIRDAVACGTPDLPAVAERLSMSASTLEAHLFRLGTSFEKALDHQRQLMAIKQLRNESLTVADVAYLLGYESPTDFAVAFERWTGVAPDAFRT